MKFPGGNPLLFCEQVSTVTSFFEQWNDCERTVVLYALLKRVPFANLKFLQLSIDYNLAQNYSSQSKLQLLETHANNANFLNKLVQRYQQTSTTTTTVATSANNNNTKSTTGSTPPKSSSCNISNNNLTVSDSGYDSEKTRSSFDLSSTGSLPCSVSSTAAVAAAPGQSSSTSSSSSSDKSGPGATADKPTDQIVVVVAESKKDILNDMLTYLPLLKPGNDDVKSVYMSLIPAAVEDACQQHVPTELVQHILSYLLIHPAVNNDDRRSLSYWLRHLEEHIATSYIPTTLAAPSSLAAAPTANNNNNNTNTSNIAKLANSGNYFTLNQQQQQHLAANSNTSSASKPGSQQSLQFLATGPWQHHIQQQQQHSHLQQQQHHQNQSNAGSNSSSCNPLPPVGSVSNSSLISISNSSLSLSRSQQSLNQAAGGGGGSSSSSSSSSCLDSASSQLLKSSSGSTGSGNSNSNNSMVVNLDWTTSTEISAGGTEDGGGGGGGAGGGGVAIRGSMENLALKDFGAVAFGFPTPPPGTKPIGNGSGAAAVNKHHHHHHHHHHGHHQHLLGGTSSGQPTAGSSQSSVTANAPSSSTGAGLSLNGTHQMVLTDLDSSDDNHLSFSKNGTEIFDYDCDYDNEEEFNYLARAAAAVAAGESVPRNVTGAAGSAVTPGTSTTTNSSAAGGGTGKNRVSFDANISDYLRVPPIGTGDLVELDGSGLLKTRRSNSLTTTVGGSCGGLSVGEGLHQHQKQNNECLSAENLTNLQLLQNKPRSFSLTMESPRSSLTSSGSETRLDDFKQHHHMMKMYGQQPNVGMASIAHWLKSLRLHKYVWLFSNLTYEQMMEMTEEYLASLGVTKGARHKLVLCIQKLRERYGVMVRLEKDLLASKAQLGAVFEELTNIVLTPMKPVDHDDKEDIARKFLDLLELIGTMLLMRPTPQDEEYLSVYVWLLERALHNEAFCDNAIQLKEYKYKANKLKMSYAPKNHYAKAAGALNGNINKPRWSVSNKHKPGGPGGPDGGPQKTPHRKSSLQYFSSPMQQQQSQQQSSSSGQQPQASSSSHTHLQAIPPHQYYGTGHNNNYNKSSSYPNFASNMSGSGGSSNSGSGGSGAIVKHHSGQQPQQQQQHAGQQQHPQQQQQPHHPPGPSHVPHGANFMYQRHSLNNISAHQHQQQFLQHLQQNQQQQQQQLLPSIYLSAMGGTSGGQQQQQQNKAGKAQQTVTTAPPPPVPTSSSSGDGSSAKDKTDLLGSKSQNNSIGDINSRLEFLCLQMTEQAIN